MRHWIVLLVCGLAAASTFGGEVPANLKARQATIRAFDALLAHEGATPPNSEWQHTAPQDYETATTDLEGEEALVAYLARQKAAGADFNAIRHEGTLLHHALRAGFEYTAQWLLDQGGDPLQGSFDSLVLAIQYRRWYVAEQLLGMPKVRARHAADTNLSAWRAAEGKDERAVVSRLLKLRLPKPTGAHGEALLALAIERHWLPLVLSLTEAGVRRAKHVSCSRMAAQPPGGWRRAELEKADRNLVEPLLPNLLAYVGDVATLNKLLAMSLRQPWNDAAFARRVIDCTLEAPLPSAVQRAILARIGEGALAAALSDERLAARWGNWLLDQPEPTARWAMARLASQPGGVVRVARRLVDLDYSARAATADRAPGAGWAALIDHLPSPFPDELQGRLWRRVPERLYPYLLGRGYRPDDEELFDWTRWRIASEPSPVWSALIEARPDLKQRYPEILFADALGERAGHCRHFPLGQTLAVVDWFLDAGHRPAHPLRIDALCWRRMTAEIQARLGVQGVLAGPPEVELGRFVPVTRSCKMPATSALRRALADLSNDWVGVQMINQPGRDDCGLVLHFHPQKGNGGWQDDEGSEYFRPICPESEYSYKLMRIEGEVVTSIPIEGDSIGAMLPVRDAKTGRDIFVAGQMDRARCDPFPLWLLQWDNDATTANGASPRLAVLPRQDEVVQAWLSHCLQMDVSCIAPDQFPKAEALAEIDSTATTVDRIFTAERQSFITAVLADDQPRLAQELAAGVFPHWAVPAMAAVEATDLPVEAKRLRLAGLLRDPRRAAALANQFSPGEVMHSVIAWLPIEDWKPLLAGMWPYALKQIENRATELGRHDLACLLATQRFARCRAN